MNEINLVCESIEGKPKYILLYTENNIAKKRYYETKEIVYFNLQILQNAGIIGVVKELGV